MDTHPVTLSGQYYIGMSEGFQVDFYLTTDNQGALHVGDSRGKALNMCWAMNELLRR